MDVAVLFGFFMSIGISLVPVAILAAFLHFGGISVRAVALGRRLHLLRPPEPPPAGPPIEKLAADLRRLQPVVRSLQPGVGLARQRGFAAAYDGALIRIAKALGVPTTLAELPEGIDHEAEQLRLEYELELAGLSWHVQEL